MKRDNSLYVSIIVNIVAIVVCCIGMFTEHWWVDNDGNYYDIFTTVNCENDICYNKGDSSEAWIIVAIVLGLLELTMLAIATLTQLFMVCSSSYPRRRQCSTIGLVTIGIACLAPAIQMFMVSAVYSALTKAYGRMKFDGQLLYISLSPGLCAVSGIICIPVAVCLILWRIQNKPGFDSVETKA